MAVILNGDRVFRPNFNSKPPQNSPIQFGFIGYMASDKKVLMWFFLYENKPNLHNRHKFAEKIISQKNRVHTYVEQIHHCHVAAV